MSDPGWKSEPRKLEVAERGAWFSTCLNSSALQLPPSLTSCDSAGEGTNHQDSCRVGLALLTPVSSIRAQNRGPLRNSTVELLFFLRVQVALLPNTAPSSALNGPNHGDSEGCVSVHVWPERFSGSSTGN